MKIFFHENKLLFIMSILMLLPTTLNFYFEISISVGIVIFIVLFLAITYFYNKNILIFNLKQYLKVISIITSILLIHTLLVYILFGDEPNFLRIFLSIIFFGIVTLTTLIFVKFIFTMDDKNISKTISILFYFMLIIGYLSLFLFQNNMGYPGYAKPMIIASEPSHFAMIFIPIALSYLYSANIKYKIILSILILILAILLPNLSLMIGTFLIIFCIFKRKYLISILFFGIAIILISPNNVSPYILGRIDILSVITRDTNLSLLVYLSGIERGYLDLIYSYGIGIGFNNFGYIGPLGKYSLFVKDIFNGFLLCFNDGSVLVVKFIGEFGIIAIILTVFYLYFLTKLLIIIKKNEFTKSKDVLFASFFISFSIYLFVRGFGYFTPMTFMFISSIYWYYLKLYKRRIL